MHAWESRAIPIRMLDYSSVTSSVKTGNVRQSITGITILHGRLTRQDATNAQSWATTIDVRSLVRMMDAETLSGEFTVVKVAYPWLRLIIALYPFSYNHSRKCHESEQSVLPSHANIHNHRSSVIDGSTDGVGDRRSRRRAADGWWASRSLHSRAPQGKNHP